MLCGNCKKNQATKTYEQIKKGKKAVEYYCLDCYHRLFIAANEQSDAVHACPYCETTAEEIKKRKIVGCANCYKSLQSVLYPLVSKMQGELPHTGKKPLGGEAERLARRCYELKTVAEKLRADGDLDGARARQERLSHLQDGLFEEDFVWHKRRDLFKHS